MQDYCKYVDVFMGSGETDRIFEDGLASKWFYIKALCGNTLPHAALPFGKMSVGAYSGGYPGGYGTHYPNFCGGIRKLSEEMLVSGFSHLHQSGTGDIQFFYNYAIVSPFFGEVADSRKARRIKDENGVPGYYSVRLGDIGCELTVSGEVARHRYTFGKEDGQVSVDFSNDGLAKVFGEKYYSFPEDCTMAVDDSGAVTFSGIFSGVRLYFAVIAKNATRPPYLCLDNARLNENTVKLSRADKPMQAVFEAVGTDIEIAVAYSTVSVERALGAVYSDTLDFDSARARAYDIWNEHLSRIKIETDSEELNRKFYSNLYHSLIKPVDMTGECVLGVKGDTVVDIATFWDQYKTALPLIYACYPEMAEKIVRGIINISRTMGRICCSFSLSDLLPAEMQAKMLGVLTLVDAYRMGVRGVDKSVLDECIARELGRDDYKSFVESGVFERYTHIIDTTDACFAVADITDNEELRGELLALAENWRNAYGEDGLMSEKSRYYEGDRYTYSYRLQYNMEERVQLLGGKEKLCERLDNFFGFGGESVKQITHLDAYPDIKDKAYHRFEGFNNECDMETPYAYIYADRHDRLEDIMRECVERSFGVGRGGLPGNNDSGGLSSFFVFSALGIFPASGKGEFLIGVPAISEAELSLSGGKTLRIIRKDNGGKYVSHVSFNGTEVEGYRLPMGEVMAGGELVVEL